MATRVDPMKIWIAPLNRPSPKKNPVWCKLGGSSICTSRVMADLGRKWSKFQKLISQRMFNRYSPDFYLHWSLAVGSVAYTLLSFGGDSSNMGGRVWAAAMSRRRRRRGGRRMGRGYPPPQPTRGSGERRKLPQRGLAASDFGAFSVQFYAISRIS